MFTGYIPPKHLLRKNARVHRVLWPSRHGTSASNAAARRQNERFRVASHRMFPGRAVQTRVRGCFKNVCDGESGYITGNRILYMYVGHALPVGRTKLRLVVVPHVRRRRTVPLRAWTRRRRGVRDADDARAHRRATTVPCHVRCSGADKG